MQVSADSESRGVFEGAKTVGMVVLLIFTLVFSVRARDNAPFLPALPMVVVGPSDDVTRLNDAIEQVLKERRFAWRLPREKEEDKSAAKEGWAAGLLRGVADFLGPVAETIADGIKAVVDWIEDLFPPSPSSKQSEHREWHRLHRAVFYLFGGAFVILLVFLIRRWWRARKQGDSPARKPPEAIAVDVNDDTVTAQDLPTDRWLVLAAELMEKHHFRRALRAFYLSVISLLGDTDRVVIARHKSNLDYHRELARRAHAEPEVLQLFQRCMHAFERAWYGMHPVSRDQLDLFVNNQERIRALVRQAI